MTDTSSGSIVDTHPHVFTSPSEKYPLAPVGGEQSRWSRGVEVTGDVLRSMMDGAGVAQAVIVQTSTVYGYDNSFVADTVAADPVRFAGVCSVNPTVPSGCDDLRYWIGERGLVGVRMFTSSSEAGDLYAFDDSGLEVFWECVEEVGVPVDLQIKYAVLPVVGDVARRHPDITLVIDHTGGAPIATGPAREVAADLFRLAESENVYVKFSGHNLDRADQGPGSAAEFISDLVAEFGANRILWGSNFPNTFGTRPATLETYQYMVGRLHESTAGLSETDRQWVLGGTARTVYRGL